MALKVEQKRGRERLGSHPLALIRTKSRSVASQIRFTRKPVHISLSYNCPSLSLKRLWSGHNVSVGLERGGSRLCSPLLLFSPVILSNGMCSGSKRGKN